MKYKNCLISAGIISFALLIVLWAFNYVNISDDRRWTDLTQTFLYPLSCTLIGSVILSCAAIAISNNILNRYNDRIGYGLTNRKIYFEGDSDSIKTIRDTLQISDLIKRENYMDPSVTAITADIAILCIKKTYKKQSNTDPKDPCCQATDTEEYSKWKTEAADSITSLKDRLTGQQALIVYTDGWLDGKTKALINNRPFSVLVNFSGRIVSDIHSLLTTLPPRSGE